MQPRSLPPSHTPTTGQPPRCVLLRFRTLGCLAALALMVGCAQGAPLTFRWSPEVSRAEPYDAQAFHGETFTLAATPLQYGQPLTGLTDAGAKLYWQTPGMEPTQWYTAPGAYDPATGTLTATWTPAMDVGGDRVTFFLALTQGDAVAYRVYGRLRLAASPGFNPAELVPEDVRQELIDDITADVKGWADATYQPKGDYLTDEADPTVPAWAKADAKPAYTADEVGAAQASHTHDGRYPRLSTAAEEVTNPLSSAMRFINRAADGTAKPIFRFGSQFTSGTNTGDTMREDRWCAELFYDSIRFISTLGTDPRVLAFGAGTDDSIVRKAELDEAAAAKLDKSAVDEEPTEGSANPAKSGGIFAWVKNLLTGYLPLAGGTLTGNVKTKGVTFGGDVSGTAWTLKMGYIESSGAPRSGNGLIRRADLPNYLLEGENVDITTDSGTGKMTFGVTAFPWGAITGAPDFLTAESDPTVSAWAKAPQKPTYTAAEVGAATATHTHAQGDVTGLSAALAAKQDALTAGEGITIEGNVISSTGGGTSIASGDALKFLTPYTSDEQPDYLFKLCFDDNTSNLTVLGLDGEVIGTFGDKMADTAFVTKAYVDEAIAAGGGGSYTLPKASASTLGGVKVDGSMMRINEDGTILPSVCVDYNWVPYVLIGEGLSFDLESKTLKASGGSYTLPKASASTLGGVKVGNGLTIAGDGTLSATPSAPQGSAYWANASYGASFGYDDDRGGVSISGSYATGVMDGTFLLAISGRNPQTGENDKVGLDVPTKGYVDALISRIEALEAEVRALKAQTAEAVGE